MFRLIVIVAFFFLQKEVIAQKLPTNYYRAQAAIENKNIELAALWIDSALIAAPRNPVLWVKKGEIQFRKQNYNESISSFQLAEDYRKGIASYWLAKAYAMQLDKSKALAELERHLSNSPKETEATILLDTAFSGISKTFEWQKFWLTDWYTASERLISSVQYHFSRKDWDYAIDLLNERMDGRTVRHQLYALRGEALFNVGSFKSAEADFAQALKRSRRNHHYMYWRSKALLALNKNKDAIRLLTNAIDQSGGEPSYYKLRAQAFASHKDYTNAVDDIRHYLTFYPNNFEAIASFAEYSMESGKLIDALFQLGKLIINNPNNPNFHFMRGKIYMKSGNWNVAEIDLSESIKLNPFNAEAFLLRGNCRSSLGRKAEACSDWKRAFELGDFKAQELVYKNCR